MIKRLLQTLSLFLVFSLISGQQTANFRPIIGVISVPSEYPDRYPSDTYSDIHGSAVGFIESGGARVVPIPWDVSDAQLNFLLSSVNGILIGGDEAKLYTKSLFGHRKATAFTNRIQTILNYAIDANNNGTYYPILGINVGFAVIPALLAGDLSIIEETDYTASNGLQNHEITLKNSTSRIFSLFTPYQLSFVTKHKVLSFNNAYGIKAMSFESNSKLKSLFKVAATYKENLFNAYVAAAEGTHLPIYITQFSPQLGRYARDDSYEVNYIANIASSALANFFANETRSNPNSFPDLDSEDANLIYQHDPQFMGPTAPRVFFFTPNGKAEKIEA